MHFRWSFIFTTYDRYFLPGSKFAPFEEVKVPVSNSAEFFLKTAPWRIWEDWGGFGKIGEDLGGFGVVRVKGHIAIKCDTKGFGTSRSIECANVYVVQSEWFHTSPQWGACGSLSHYHSSLIDTPFDVANGLPEFVSEERPRNCLSADDIIDKYKEAISHYSKVSFAWWKYTTQKMLRVKNIYPYNYKLTS